MTFYDNFKQWSDRGKSLLNLHINYETVEPLKRKKLYLILSWTQSKFKADKENDSIILDENAL